MQYSIRKRNDFIVTPLVCKYHGTSQENQENNVFLTPPKKSIKRTANKNK
jgi:hypothetical protein